jgi:short-subunit dehydrogenase
MIVKKQQETFMPSATVACITGASSGIGCIYADRLAKRGFDLLLVARRLDRLQAIAQRLHRDNGVDVRVMAADVTVEEDLLQIEDVLRSNRTISMLVNNAGNGILTGTLDMTDADTKTTIALNVIAPTRLSRAVLPRFVERNEGTIVNIASVMALHTLPLTTLYGATKSYVLSFSRGLQTELAGTAVRVQAVLPGTTATEFFNQSSIDIAELNADSIMPAEDMVDAALAGLDRGELVTLPSVHGQSLWSDYETARLALFEATQNGVPAPRYR